MSRHVLVAIRYTQARKLACGSYVERCRQLDELLLSLAPTFLGGGVRLFEGIDKNAVDVSIVEAVSSPEVTHLRYALKKKG